ncbi:hypothetical protein [Deinococcus aestuarii]|uniref:hypothetical protein n=1 Tax=Deinococcus aestuarii TaxID=2774531 RepID=UPI001C0AA67C|nr:hypothetical protein [Deinococcus aestuarii]
MSQPRLLHVGDLYALRPDLKPRWRVAAILHRGRSYDDVRLEHLTNPTLTSRARVYHPGLNPTDLTLPVLVRLLDRAYRADQGTFRTSPLNEADRQRLADYLACHDLVREAAWEDWNRELGVREQDAARYWLDLTLMDPAPEDADRR